MRGIVGATGYIPRGRLDLSGVAAVAGTGGGRGTRSTASYDEDATTMAVAAGRRLLQSVDPGVRRTCLEGLSFAKQEVAHFLFL